MTLTLDGGDPQTANVKKSGRARVKWEVIRGGDFEICVVECPDICRRTECRE